MHEDDTIATTQPEPYAKQASPPLNCPSAMPMYHLNSVVLIHKRRSKTMSANTKAQDYIK